MSQFPATVLAIVYFNNLRNCMLLSIVYCSNSNWYNIIELKMREISQARRY
jgi:hypothetical protein